MKTAEEQQAEKIRTALGGMSSAQRGACQSIDWAAGTASVNVGGATVDLPMLAAPVVGAYCWVGLLGSTMMVLGPVPPSKLATAAGSPTSGLVTVVGDDSVSYTVAANGFTITSGTRVLLDWGDRGGYVVALVSADPLTGTPVTGGGNAGGVAPKTKTFNPTGSGTQNSSYGSLAGSGNFWTPQVYCGDTTLGAYFYGSQIGDTIPNGATILSGSIRLVEISGSGSAPSLGTHSLGGPSGGLVVGNVMGIPGGSGAKKLSAAILNALKTGAAKGIATAHGGYHIFGPASQCGAITITWTV